MESGAGGANKSLYGSAVPSCVANATTTNCEQSDMFF